jgi:lipid-binding SYLF domain-containing protein
MNTATRLLGATILSTALSLGAVGVAPANAQAVDQQATVDRAALVVGDLRHDKEFGNARNLMQRARAVMIVPRLVKGGFFVGGEGGDGVLLTHKAAGGWSQPAFYAIGSASFGLQIGLQQSEMVMFVMSQKGLDALMQDQFKIGANAGLAVVTLGGSVEGATTAAVGPDIVVWASSSGAYAGVSLNGSIVKPQYDQDRVYYGPGVTQRDILFRGTVANPQASPLVQALGTLG